MIEFLDDIDSISKNSMDSFNPFGLNKNKILTKELTEFTEEEQKEECNYLEPDGTPVIDEN